MLPAACSWLSGLYFKTVGMIPRRVFPKVIEALSRQAALALIGPRHVRKTIEALEVGHSGPRSTWASSGTQMRSPDNMGTRGQDALVEKLNFINVARTPA
jgi:hypothetical protein